MVGNNLCYIPTHEVRTSCARYDYSLEHVCQMVRQSRQNDGFPCFEIDESLSPGPSTSRSFTMPSHLRTKYSGLFDDVLPIAMM